MANQNKELNNEISLVELWSIFINHIKFIVIFTTIIFVFSIIYVNLIITPDYVSNADLMVQVEQDTSSSNNQNFDLVNAFRLIDTVAELMEKDVILNNAIERLKLLGYDNIDVEFLREGLSVRTSSTSYFINVSFVDKEQELAKVSVDAIIEAVIEETDLDDAFPVLEDKIRRTSFASEPVYNSPNKTLFSLIGFILGLLISTGIVFSKEFLSTHFKSKDEVESVLEIPVIGVIPLKEVKEKRNGKK